LVAEPAVSNTNSKNRRSHNTAEPINSRSKVLHVRAPENTALYNIYREGEDFMAHPWQAATTANDKHLIKS